MAKKNKDIRAAEAVSNLNERIRLFKDAFSREDIDVRNRLVQDLPAYNILLSMGSESFEEIALHLLARECGEQYNPVEPPLPHCPSCGTNKTVRKRKPNVYRCNTCKNMFAANTNSISSGTKCDALTWAKLIQCLFSFYGQTKTCEYCGISPETYFSLRNRIFYAMQVYMDDIKLSGEIQVDNTFVRVSYKGLNLQAHDYPEESVFYDDAFIPRTARSRGGHYSYVERNSNTICIFTAIDDRSRVLVRYAGVGITDFRTLSFYLPAEKFLLEVPKEDSFSCRRDRHAVPKTRPGDKTYMVADKEGSIQKYAQSLGLEFESHVYRKNNIQLKLPNNTHNIQRVNALHKRLKDFLRNTGYVSTKYLPGYLTMFEFVENVGASQEAIQKIMETLATPNLGKSATYYQELFSVPNYLLEWFESDGALQKIPYNKLLAFYLYDHIRNKDAYPNTDITMKFIETETQYTAPSIRKIYRDLNNAGYRSKILKYFGEPEDPSKVKKVKKNEVQTGGTKKSPAAKTAKQKQQQFHIATFNPTVLAIYDEYAQIRQMPDGKRPAFHVFLAEKNKQYGTNYTISNMYAKFRMIEKNGVRPPLPDINRFDNNHGKWSTAHAGIVAVNRSLPVLEEYNRIVLSYREKGEPVPKNNYIYSLLSEKFGMSYSAIQNCLTIARSYKRKLAQEEEHSKK